LNLIALDNGSVSGVFDAGDDFIATVSGGFVTTDLLFV
jgi:hypothetical protein